MARGKQRWGFPEVPLVGELCSLCLLYKAQPSPRAELVPELSCALHMWWLCATRQIQDKWPGCDSKLPGLGGQMVTTWTYLGSTSLGVWVHTGWGAADTP